MVVLNALLSDLDADLGLFAEAWFGEESAPLVEGFDIFRRDRGTGRGGGVADYVNKRVAACEVSSETFEDARVEQVWCSCTVGRERVLVECIYRPPGQDQCSVTLGQMSFGPLLVLLFSRFCWQYLKELNVRRGDYEAMSNELNALDWDQMLDSCTPDESCRKIQNIYSELCAKHIPISTKLLSLPPL